MPKWRVRLLGKLRVEQEDGPPVRFRTRATEAVFAYLALHPQQEVRRDVLASIAWPEASDEAGARSLRTALSSLRQTFGAALQSDRQSAWLQADAFDTDVQHFRSERNPSEYRGRLLEGFAFDWVYPLAFELEELFAQSVIEQCGERHEAEAIQLVTRALAIEPTRLDLRIKLRELCPAHDMLQMPSVATTFVGRRAETDAITKLFIAHRLVTLTGPGGCGKSRLASEICAIHQPDAWFVPLAHVSEADSFFETLRASLRIPETSDVSAREQLGFALRELPALIVLDNFEQILSAGSSLAELLADLPRLRILVTSRVPLGLVGEIEYPIGPLESPDSKKLLSDRMHSVYPELNLTPYEAEITKLCDRLDGYPLAIELAAAKARLMTPQEMLLELDHRFEFLEQHRGRDRRHASLHQALDWSFELLPTQAQDLLADLTVFSGNFTRAAVDGVLGKTAIEPLEILVSAGWLIPIVTSEPRRFRLLESIRQFAGETLPPTRRRALERAHAHHYLRFAEQCAEQAFTPFESRLHDQADLDLPNLDQAWEWLIDHEPNAALKFVTGLNWYAVLRGRSQLAQDRICAALEQSTSPPPIELAFAYHCRGNFFLFQRDHDGALPWYQQARDIGLAEGDLWHIGQGSIQLAQVHAELGNYAVARREVNLGIKANLERGMPSWTGAAYVISTLVANRQGDVETAVADGLRAVDFCKRGGYSWGIASALNELAMAHFLAGDHERSLEVQNESLAIKRQLIAPGSLALSLADLAMVQLEMGNVSDASLNLREAVEVLGSNHLLGLHPVVYVTGSRLLACLGHAEGAAVCRSVAARLVSPSERRHAHWVDFWRDVDGESGSDVHEAVHAIQSL